MTVPCCYLLAFAVFGWGFGNSFRLGRKSMAKHESELINHRAVAQTILVELFDEAGNPLPPAEAEAKLAAVRLTAGPQDVVLGLRQRRPEPPAR